MNDVHDLQFILNAIRDRVIDADRAAALAAAWSPAVHPHFQDYLRATGAIPAQDGELRTITVVPSHSIADTVTQVLEPQSSTLQEAAAEPSTVTYDSATDFLTSSTSINSLRYQPLKLHRQGGLGQVWRAHDTVLGRDVALKMIRPDRVSRGDLRRRFVREAQVTGRLEHPSIVPLYDLVDADDAHGRGPRYVMRFVAGQTLAEATTDYHVKLSKRQADPLELRRLVEAVVTVCQAVAFAHTRGVLHRDLKGQNVVLGDFGEVFLLDWGLTTAAGEGPDTDAPAALVEGETTSGGIAGTPAYMSPEVAAGRPATKASDIYGLGTILYSVLTGRPPIDGTTPVEILQKVLSDDPVAPCVVNPAAAPALESICRAAMAREPSTRYATAEAMAVDIRRWLADEPVSVHRESWLTRAGRWAGRHRMAVATSAVVLLTGVLALAVGSALLLQEQRKTHLQMLAANTERERAERNLDAAHVLTKSLVDVAESKLPSVRGTEVIRRDITRVAAGIFKTFAEQRPDSREIQRWHAYLNRVSGNVHRLLDDTTGAAPAYAAALAIVKDDTGARDELAMTLRDHAGLLERLGKLKEAESELDAAKMVIEVLRKTDETNREYRRIEATIHLELSSVEHARGAEAKASASADRAIALFRELTAGGNETLKNPYDLPLLATALGAKANAESRSNGYDSAQPFLREARAIMAAVIAEKAQGLDADDAAIMQAYVEFDAARIWLTNAKRDLKSNAENNLNLVLPQMTSMVSRHPNTPIYRGTEAKIRLTRGEVREARNQSALAKEDFDTARIALEGLVAANPAIPEYRADLGRACLGLARTDTASAMKWNAAALQNLQAAAIASPDNVDISKSLTAAKAAKP